VRYLLIGGVGATLHGSPLPTGDADICPAADTASQPRQRPPGTSDASLAGAAVAREAARGPVTVHSRRSGATRSPFTSNGGGDG
jgi:hypothetical protein